MDAVSVTDPRTRRLLRWGIGLTIASLLFAPAAIPAFIIGVILLGRDRVGAGVAIMLASVVLAYASVQIGLELISRSNQVTAADLREYETGVTGFVEQQGTPVDRTVCVRSGDFEAKCSAILSDGGRVRYVVSVDELDGGWSSGVRRRDALETTKPAGDQT